MSTPLANDFPRSAALPTAQPLLHVIVSSHSVGAVSELGEADAVLDEEAQIEGIHLGGGWGEVHLIRAGRLSESGTPPRDCPFTHLATQLLLRHEHERTSAEKVRS